MNLQTTARQTPRGTAEHAYRRGYADGHMSAVTAMANRPHHLSMMHLLEQMLWFWETDLLKWQNGDCTEKVLPPLFMPEDTAGTDG